MTKRSVVVALGLIVLLGHSVAAQPIDKEPEALIAPILGLSPVRVGAAADERVKWWRQARFGMFIHFGVYAVPGRGEWVMFSESIPHVEYAKFADEFTPDPA